VSDRSTQEDLYRGDASASADTGGRAAHSPTGGAGDPTWSSSSVSTGKSAGRLMKEITEDLSSLFRKEIELAKQEIGGSAMAKAKGAAIIAIAGFFGLLAMLFLLLAVRDGFDTFLWTWLADIATAVLLLVIGAIAALVARKKLQTPIRADLTKQTVKEDIEWAKSIGKR
jgi:hypothetical protein